MMKTTFDILDLLYPIISVSNVTSLIDGAVYREKKPVNSELQDIVIKPLTNNDIGSIIQQSDVNINVFCKNLNNGMPNESKLKSISDAVIAKLEAYSNNNMYFNFDIVWQIVLGDPDNEKMSFSNIRLNCRIENNT